MKIKKINRLNNKVYDAVLRFLPQLDPGMEIPGKEYFREILRSKRTHLFIGILENKEIAGMLTIVTYDIPTGHKVWIEDVVVDKPHRGKGFGRELIHFAIDFAKSTGAKSVDLTSRPSRISANKLYLKTGFVLRETNVYRYYLK